MNHKNNKKSLDKLISRAVGRENLKFDFTEWKTKHQKQIRQFHKQTEYSAKTNLWKTIIKSPITKLTAAAVIILTISLILNQKQPQTKPRQTQTAKSPAQLTTLASLSFAYRQGGMEKFEQICDKALKMAGPRPATISMQDFFEETNKGNSERKEL